MPMPAIAATLPEELTQIADAVTAFCQKEVIARHEKHHELLNNPRNISSSLDGCSDASFDYETSAPYRNSVFGGAGISAKFGDRCTGSVFYNVNFGAEGYTNNIISTSLGFAF